MSNSVGGAQKATTPEAFVQSAVVSNLATPIGTHGANMTATIEVRPNGTLDGASHKGPAEAKTHGANELARIAIKDKARVLFVNATDVIVAKAEGNYVALIHKSGCHLVRETMATAEEKLSPLGFVRIHRSILVNANLVKDLRRDSTGTYLLRTTDGTQYPVGRAYKHNLKVIACSWLGTDVL